jgi:putative acetyltransferase
VSAGAAIRIRDFCEADLKPVVTLFRETVHRINSRDYSPEQIAVWSPPEDDWPRWKLRFGNLRTLVAESEQGIVGFTSFTDAGYVDFLFVHHEHQREGIATALIRAAEGELMVQGIRRATVHASITARLFFEKMGYMMLETHSFEKDGVLLTNFAMDKDLERHEEIIVRGNFSDASPPAVIPTS